MPTITQPTSEDASGSASGEPLAPKSASVSPPTPQKEGEQSAQRKGSEKLIIHHLSDLRYHDDDANTQRQRLFRYRRYLDSLPDTLWPSIVVITGDLTDTGARSDLRAVANFLAASFPKWEGELHQHIFVIPGVRDINWEGVKAIGWDAFRESFSRFALPAYRTGPAPTPAPGGGSMGGTPGIEATLYTGYAICTCYQPSELTSHLRKQLATYTTDFHAFTRMRDQLGRRSRWWRRLTAGASADAKRTNEDLADARKRYLWLTEGNPTPILDSGRVLDHDIAAFGVWLSGLKSPTGRDQLRFVVTHHPLSISPDQAPPDGRQRAAEQSFKKLATTVTNANIDLALHGHNHESRALADFSILAGSTPEHPVRQIGAPSLGDTGIFNEIIAERQLVKPESKSESKPDPSATSPAAPPEYHWQFELRLINVDEQDLKSKPPFLLLNPTESADRLARRLEASVKRRDDFDERMRVAMRQFAERVDQSYLEKQQGRGGSANLPQSAMQVVEAIIRDIIFDGCAVRVRALLKDESEHRPFAKLSATYLAPPIFEGPDTLVYPASVAAWCLVLGRTLHYPAIKSEKTKLADHEWLRNTKKISGLMQALSALQRDLYGQSQPDQETAKRYDRLKDALEKIDNHDENAFIDGGDIFQSSFDLGQSRTYPAFICVPYPLRPKGGAQPSMPETVTLDVGVRPLSEQSGTSDIFTDERIRMLESLAELIGMMLTTANALGKPRGLWDDRVKG